MRIQNLRDYQPNQQILTTDDTRKLFTQHFFNVQLTGRSVHYPNCLLLTPSNTLVNPYDERVMSLQKDSFYDNNEWDLQKLPITSVEHEDVFFFVYNVDNYYHFIYDTMPMLHSYLQYKKKSPFCKLLIQTSHPSKSEFSPFVLEFLKSLGISDFLLANNHTLYSTMIVSTSYTHGGQSNEPPAKACYSLWNLCSSSLPKISKEFPKRFYISRRSWIHGKTENLGTNYTQRRKCENEDSLVAMLKKYDIEEIFTELLTTEEKLALFANAELVVGIVGGGMCNLLFSSSTTKSLCIETPYFLNINSRFRFSMNHTNIMYSDCSTHVQMGCKFLLYSRVRVINPDSSYIGKIGEVEGYEKNCYRVRLSSNDVAGFSQDFPMQFISFEENELEAVDKGLNSPFVCDLEKLESDLNILLKN